MLFNLENAVKAEMFGKVTQKSGRWHSGKKLNSHLLLYITKGSLGIQIENTVYDAEEKDVLLIPKGVFYKPLESAGCTYYFFHFCASISCDKDTQQSHITVTPHSWLTDGYAFTYSGDYESLLPFSIHTKNTSYKVKELMEKASALHPGKLFADKLLLDNLMREILITVSKFSFKDNTNKRLSEITEYISSTPNDHISLSSLSKKFGISESYISRLFKSELSMKPSEYINRVKISTASALLLNSNMTITEVAEKVGYSDVYYFSKVFKRITGTSPSKMKNS